MNRHERIAGEILEHCQNSGCWELCDQQDAIDSIANIIEAEHGPIEEAVHAALDYIAKSRHNYIWPSYNSVAILARLMSRWDGDEKSGRITERQ